MQSESKNLPGQQFLAGFGPLSSGPINPGAGLTWQPHGNDNNLPNLLRWVRVDSNRGDNEDILRQTIRQWFDPLVHRALTLVILVILVTAVSVTIINMLVSRQELDRQTRSSLSTVASLVSADLDDKIAERFNVLTAAAGGLSMDERTLLGQAQRLLSEKASLQQLFDGIYLFDQHGKVIAESPTAYAQVGLDVSDRDYFQQTSRQLTSLISAPFRNHYNQKPTVMMTAPVFDQKQRFIGVLGGAIVLGSNSFLGNVSRITLENTGYVGVGSRAGITLAHPRDAAIMQPLPRGNEALAEAQAGFEGTRLRRNSQGVETLTAFHQMDQAPWFVAVVMPVAEAFAPANRLRDTFAGVVLGVMLLLGPLVWLIFRRLMEPLADLNRQVSANHLDVQSKPIRVRGGLEIRTVAHTLNRMMAERSQAFAALQEREAFFRALSGHAPVGIVQTDVLGRIDFVNPAFEAIIGLSTEQLLDQYLGAGIYREDRSEALAAWRQALRENRVFQHRFRVGHELSERLVWVDVMTSSIETPDQCMGTISVVRDITHEMTMEAQLQNEQARAESILGVLQEGVLMTDSQGHIRFLNEAASSFLGAGGNYAGHNFFELVQISDSETTWTREDFLTREATENLDLMITNTRGQLLDVELTMLQVNPGDAAEQLVFVLRDDRERRMQEAQLSWEATHDSLTGLYNRRAFTDILVQWIGEARNLSTPSVLMLIDLDYFKAVNDRGGHLVGDELLRYLANVFSESVRQSDFVARLGGDEFGIILPACGLRRAGEIAEQIRRAVAELSIESDGDRYSVTTSIGLTEINAGDTGHKEVMGRADEGCYAAKARGRNAVMLVPAEGIEGH